MDIHATRQFLRMSPKKVREIADLVRGSDVARAEEQLAYTPRSAARPVLTLLLSAVANAEHNFDLVKENLYIKAIAVNEGPTLGRFRPRAFGRANPIRHRSAHLAVTLAEREEGKRGGRARREEARQKKKGTTEKQASASSAKAGTKHAAHAEDAHAHGGVQPARGGALKRIFSRKVGSS